MSWLEVPGEQARVKAIEMLKNGAEIVAEGPYGIVVRDEKAELSLTWSNRYGSFILGHCCVRFLR